MPTITYEGGTYTTYGPLPEIGARAPDVSLVNTRLHNVSLANWLGMRKILNIIPSVDTPAGARSAIAFDKLAREDKDLATLVISYDLPFAYERFMNEHSLTRVIGLSAIRHAGFGHNYGVEIMDGPLAGMYAPAVVVLDENNTVVHREQIENVGTEPDYEAAYRALGITVDADSIKA